MRPVAKRSTQFQTGSSQRRHLFDGRGRVRDFQQVIPRKADVILAVRQSDVIDHKHLADPGRAAAGQRAERERELLSLQRRPQRQRRGCDERIVAAAREPACLADDRAGVLEIRRTQ